MKPQTAAVLKLLCARGDAGVTTLEALRAVGTFRLAARIAELRDDGHIIRSTTVKTPEGAHVARYTLG